MSTSASDLITRALAEIGDPQGRRTARADMLGYFNRVQEKLATELRCLQTDYYFNLVANEPRYVYPNDMVQMSGLRVSQAATPTSLADYYSVSEMFNDEWRSATYGQRPSAWVYGYIARPSWFELVNAPTASVTDGGILTTWRIPAWLVSEAAPGLMELPDWMRGTVQEGMQILASKANDESDTSRADWEVWVKAIDTLREKFEDRSDDRRAAIRPPGNGNWTQGMR